MKKLLALFTSLLITVSAQAAYKSGEDYQELNLDKSTTPIVTEFFSFYCPHCMSFEPLMNELKKQIPDNTKFQRVHVSFLGRDMAVPMAKAYATMVSLEVEDKMVPYIFSQIHEKNSAPSNEQELRQMFIDNGISAEKFDGTYKSFAIDSMQKRFDKQVKDAGLTGVPSVVVNNKYLVKTTNVKTADDYFDLVNYLLSL